MKKTFIFISIIIFALSSCTNSSSTESDQNNDNTVDKETFSGTSNSNGEYTFHSDVYNQDITVKVKSNSGTSLSNKNVEVASTKNNLIVIVSDPSKNYYPNIVITPSSNAKFLSKPEFGVIAVVLFAYTVAKTAKWLAEDPPYWDAGFRDGKLNEVCFTGDLEDLINTFSLITGGIGGIIQVGSTVVSSLNLASSFGQVIDFGVNEMTGAVLDANFDMDRDYTYCYYLPGADKSPLACLYIKDVGPAGSNSDSVIMPLKVDNSWTFQSTDYKYSHQSGVITHTILGTYDKYGYTWYHIGGDYQVAFRNNSEGCWQNSTYRSNYLFAKYPANIGDTYSENWNSGEAEFYFTCTAINAIFEQYSNCYSYKLTYPADMDDDYDIYYYKPNIGNVGSDSYVDGILRRRDVLISYVIN